MRKIPHILHFITPDNPSTAAKDNIQKISAIHTDWEVNIWTDSFAPSGGKLDRYYQKSGSGAQIADLMRIDAIWAHGGIYIDTDFIVDIRLDQFADNYEFFIGTEDGDFPTNALFGAAPRHPALDAVIGALLDKEPDWALPANRTTGPHLFKRVLQWRSDVALLPRETFYPYRWNEAPKPRHRLSYATHLWDGSWLEANARPAPRGGNASATKLSPALSARIEISKFLSTIGFKRAGASLWNQAHGLQTRREVDTQASGTPDFGSYTVGDEVFVRTRHGTILVCDGRDVSITPHLALNGSYEWAEEIFLKRILTGGDWFVDVGANIGNHAILAATCVGPFGRVFAFEPNQRCSSLMRRSAVINWVHDRLRVREAGVSDEVGEARFVRSASLLGGAAIDTGAPRSDCLDLTLAAVGESETVTIETTTLDAEFPVPLPIKILKIDAEGHEPAILRGASQLFANKGVDYVMVEALVELAPARWHENVAAFERLIDYGYAAARLSEDGLLVEHATLQEALDNDASRTLIFHVPS